MKIQWVYLAEIAGTWAQILDMTSCYASEGSPLLSLIQLWRQLTLMSEQTFRGRVEMWCEK